jgi:hypothetical protein
MKRYVINGEGVPTLSWNMNRSRGIAGLGALAVDAVQTLRVSADALYEVLDNIATKINANAASGALEAGAVGELQATRDALREMLDTHVALLETIEHNAIEGWNTGLRQLEQDVIALNQSVDRSAVAAPVERGWGMGIWIGAAVIGAVGLGFTIRYFSRRRRG